MAIRLLRAALPRPQLSLTEAGDLIDYYRDRNMPAMESHRKTWLARHPNDVVKNRMTAAVIGRNTDPSFRG